MMAGPTHIPTREATTAWVEQWWPAHLCLDLPATFDAYWTMVDKDVRTQCRKAARAGFVARWTTAPNQEDIAAVWDSWEGDLKNDRPVSRFVKHFDAAIGTWTTELCWPFSYYPHTQGYLDMIEVVDECGVLVAYLELATSGTRTVVWHTLGHKYYLKYGIMKLLFIEAIKGLIARGGAHLYYLKPAYLEKYPNKAPFANDLRFKAQVAVC